MDKKPISPNRAKSTRNSLLSSIFFVSTFYVIILIIQLIFMLNISLENFLCKKFNNFVKQIELGNFSLKSLQYHFYQVFCAKIWISKGFYEIVSNEFLCKCPFYVNFTC